MTDVMQPHRPPTETMPTQVHASAAAQAAPRAPHHPAHSCHEPWKYKHKTHNSPIATDRTACSRGLRAIRYPSR
eukprot:scaffold141378_cov31-Tisochrysis_lutea.AAC.2